MLQATLGELNGALREGRDRGWRAQQACERQRGEQRAAQHTHIEKAESSVGPRVGSGRQALGPVACLEVRQQRAGALVANEVADIVSRL